MFVAAWPLISWLNSDMYQEINGTTLTLVLAKACSEKPFERLIMRLSATSPMNWTEVARYIAVRGRLWCIEEKAVRNAVCIYIGRSENKPVNRKFSVLRQAASYIVEHKVWNRVLIYRWLAVPYISFVSSKLGPPSQAWGTYWHYHVCFWSSAKPSVVQKWIFVQSVKLMTQHAKWSAIQLWQNNTNLGECRWTAHPQE